MTEEPNNVNEFEQALRESLEVEALKVGDVIEGTIVAINGDVALVDVSGKSEAVLDRSEIDDLGTGDPVEVVVVSSGEEIRVSRRLALEAQLKEKLNEAVASGDPVEGKVVGRRKGGFDIVVSGVRGFCPISHISDVRVRGRRSATSVRPTRSRCSSIEPDSQQLVVSRAAHLDEEKGRLREEAWSKLEVGAEVEGRVRSLTDFGAFVDLGGVDGLVHVTEIAHHRVNHPREELQLDQQVQVKILDLDREKDRISLSIKALVEDPWSAAEDRYPARGPFEGIVVRKTDFGVFVQLESGIDGLLHVSQLQPGLEIDTPELEVGETVRGWVRDVDVENRRIGLTMRQMPDRDPWERIEMRYQEGQTVEGTVENGADFGVFVELEPGLSGLIPISELGLERDADPRGAFSPGEKIKLKLMALDPTRRRISLSVRALKRDLERQEYTPHMESGAEAAPAVTGFGAQLAAALDKGEAKKAETAKKKATTKKTPAKKAQTRNRRRRKLLRRSQRPRKRLRKRPPAKKAAAKKAPAKKKAPRRRKRHAKKARESEE